MNMDVDIDESLDMEIKYNNLHTEAEIKQELHQITITEEKVINVYKYCHQCEEEYDSYCSKCSMLARILDNCHIKGDGNKTIKTLPNNLLAVKKHSDSNTQGVYTMKTIPKQVIFGPHKGLKCVKIKAGTVWRLENNRPEYSKNLENLNWMYYVNYTRNKENSNLSMFQHEKNLYFQSKKEIRQGDELLVYYDISLIRCEDYAEYYQPVIQTELKRSYSCDLCCLGFVMEEYLYQHQMLCPYIEKNNMLDEDLDEAPSEEEPTCEDSGSQREHPDAAVKKSTNSKKKRKKPLNPLEAKLAKISRQYSFLALNMTEESLITNWAIRLGSTGFCLTKDQLIQNVTALAKKLKRPTPFKNGVPGRGWYKNFIKRHSEIENFLAQPQVPIKLSKGVAQNDVNLWFGMVEKYLRENNLIEAVTDVGRVFSTDEIAFFLTPKQGQVLAQRNSRITSRKRKVEGDEFITVSVIINPAGQLPPPQLIIPGVGAVDNSVKNKIPEGWCVTSTGDGWFTDETFEDYVVHVFHPWLLEKDVKLPVVLYVDRQTTNISFSLHDFCFKNGITLMGLLPNLNPLRLVYGSMETIWNAAVFKWRVDHKGERLKREDFAQLLKICLDNITASVLIGKGFESLGLYPFRFDKVHPIESVNVPDHSEETATCLDHTEPIARKTTNLTVFLAIFEDRLSCKLVKSFERCRREWDGEERYRGLFDYWKDIKAEIVADSNKTRANGSSADNVNPIETVNGITKMRHRKRAENQVKTTNKRQGRNKTESAKR